MQGLVSYSDDEDEQQQRQQLPQRPHQPSASTSAAPAASSSTRRPAQHPPSTSKLALKNQLPNLVRRPPAASSYDGSSGSAAAATAGPSSLAFANSPLRRPLEPSPDSTPTRLAEGSPAGERDEDEAELVRRLLRPPPLQNGEGWEDEYGLRRLGEEARRMAREVDPALQQKVSTFLSLKAQGTHFNDSLMKSRSFRNPTIYKKLVEFVDVDERRGLAAGIWQWEDGERDAWTTDRISDKQKERCERLAASQEAGKRDRIGFTSAAAASASASSSSRLPFSSRPVGGSLAPGSKRPPPPPSTAPALAPVQSGGKAYSLVGVGGDDLALLGKRERERDGRDHGERKREKSGLER